MNRQARRHPNKARRAALALLVTGALAAGGGIAQADLASVSGDLYIQGGGGGAGGSSNTNGGGGGGYVAYYDGSPTPSLQAYAFGGGGNGGPSSLGNGGSIGGGSFLFSPLIGYGGRSGNILYDRGNGSSVPDSPGYSGGTPMMPGVPASSNGAMPAGVSTVAVSRGSDTPSEYTGGDGGAAHVIASTLNLNRLALISGEKGGVWYPTFTYGGNGGSASLTATEVNAKAIEIQQQFIEFDNPSNAYTRSGGTVSFTTTTLSAGLGYSFYVTGSPSINITNYQFDVTGATNQQTLLVVYSPSSYTLSPTKPITLTGTPSSSLAVGNSIILINGVTAATVTTPSQKLGKYTFAFSYDSAGSGLLRATVTSIDPTITSTDTLTVTTGTGGRLALTATGSPTITWSTNGAPAGVSITGGTLNVAASLAPGTYNFDVIATNATGSDTQAFTLIVNAQPPVITSADNLTVTTGTGGSLALSATGTAPIAWSLYGGPVGVSIIGGTLTVDPSVAPGTYTFDVIATNAGGSDTQAFTLIVEYTYAVLSGFGTFTGSGTNSATIHAPASAFISLSKDGVVIDPANYTVTTDADGNTIITLTEAFLKTLKNGTYTFDANFEGGVAHPVLVVANPKPKPPKPDIKPDKPATGDSAALGSVVVTLLGSGLALGGSAVTARRKK